MQLITPPPPEASVQRPCQWCKAVWLLEPGDVTVHVDVSYRSTAYHSWTCGSCNNENQWTTHKTEPQPTAAPPSKGPYR